MKNIDLVRQLDLKEMLMQQEDCVSLYMPTHKKSEQKRQDPLRLKNLMRRAGEGLARSGMRSSRARELLDPLAELIEEYSFWKFQSEGLAVFIAPGVIKHYHLPYAFDETVVTGNHFHFKPLLPLLGEDGLFFILMLSQHSARLFQATRFSIGEIGIGELLPERAAAMKLHHDLDRHLELHTRNAAHRRPERQLPYFFGQGAHCDCRKEDIRQFFHKVAWAVHGMIREDHRPLVPAGVEYIIDIYRQVNRYPYMLENGITGNQEVTDERQLQRLALGLVDPLFDQGRKQAAQAYKDLNGTMRIDNNIERLLPAAYDGLIQTLFVPLQKQVWGKFDGNRGLLSVHSREEPGDQDLVDLTALYTLLHKGIVYTAEPGGMPGSGTLNAIYRF